MDILHFIKIIWRKRFLLAAIMVASVILAYFLVGLQPPSYKANAILSAGITTNKGIKLNQNDPFVQEFQINSKFSNMMENMKSRNSLRLLSYSLLLHDLDPEGNGTIPFRTPNSDEPLEVSEEEIQALLTRLNLDADSDESVTTTTLSQQYDAIYNSLAKAYQYDYESLLKNLVITRIGKTDYLKVEFEAEHPGLCEYAVERFCEEFIKYNVGLENKEEWSAVRFWENETLKKKLTLDTLNNLIGDYRSRRNIVNLEAQSEQIVSQIADLEVKRAEERKSIQGRKKAIDNLDNYIDKNVADGSVDYSAKANLNQQFAQTNDEIKSLREQLVSSGNDPKIQRQLDEKKQEQTKILDQLSTVAVKKGRGFEEKTDQLTDTKIGEEIDLALAEEAVKTLDSEIEFLKGRASNLVAADKDIENLQGRKEIALEEYLQAVDQLGDARLRFNSKRSATPLTVFEHAQIPEKPQPSNRMIISAFAGVASISLSTFFIFALALFDGRITSPEYFERITKSPLLGFLNEINFTKLDLEKLFDQPTADKKLNNFKESLRRIRYAIANTGAKTFLFTSTQKETGKTFTILSLAYSLSKNKKKVLIIDTNFKNNTLTGFANKKIKNNPLYNGYLQNAGKQEEVFLEEESVKSGSKFSLGATLGNISGPLALLTAKKKKTDSQIILNGKVDIVGNIQSSHSPSEILAGKDFKKIIENFEQDYDYIFLEAAALNDYSDTRELIDYSDKVIAVYSAEVPFTQADRESLQFLKELDEDKYMGGILNRVDLKNLG